MVSDWHPELYKLLDKGGVCLPLVHREQVPAPRPPAPPNAARVTSGRGNPLQGAAQAGQSPRGAPGLTRPYPEPKTPDLGPPYLSCRDGTTVVLSGHGGHTLVGAGQRVLSPADPPHFGVETEPEFLVIPLPTRPENPPE